MAQAHIKTGNRIAAIKLVKKAIGYYPFEGYYYKDLVRALSISRKNDKMPNWQLPQLLPSYITVNWKKITFSV